jgi:hypothetical protein
MNLIVLIVLRPDTFTDDAIRPDVLGIYSDTGAADSAIEEFTAVGRVLTGETVWVVPVPVMEAAR